MMNDATLLLWSLRFGDCPEYVYPDALCENDCLYAHLPTLIRYNSWDCGVRHACDKDGERNGKDNA